MPPFHSWAVHRARPTSCPSLPAPALFLTGSLCLVRVVLGGQGVEEEEEEGVFTTNVFFRNRLLLV